MADLTKTVEIIFGARDREFLRKVKSIDSAIRGIASPIADLTKDLLLMEAALITAGVAFAVSSFNKASSFQTAIVNLQKVMGDNENINDFTDAASRLSEVFGESSIDVLNSAALFRQAGFETEEAMELTKDAMTLVRVGGIEAAEGSEILIATLKGFRAPASDSARLLDILNEVSNNYAVNVRELGIAMAQISPIARNAGMSFEETAAVLTPVIEVFRHGEEAATALKNGLTKMISDSKPVVAALTRLGVTQRDLNNELRPAKDILLDVSVAFQDLSQSQKLHTAEEIVGLHQAAKMAEVFDGLAKTQDVLVTAMNAAGSAAKELALFLTTADVATAQFAVTFENLQIAIGQKYLAGTVDVIHGTQAMTAAFRDAVKEGKLDSFFEPFDAELTKLGEKFQEVALVLPEAMSGLDFSGLLSSFDNLGGSVKDTLSAMFGDLDLTNAEDLETALQGIVDVITGLTNFTTGFVKGMEPFIAGLAAIGKEFKDMGPSGQEAAGQIGALAVAIGKLSTGVVVFVKLFDVREGGVAGAIGDFSTTVKTRVNVLDVLVDLFKSSLDKLGGLSSANLGGLAGMFTETESSIKGVKEALNSLGTTVDDTAEGFKTIGDNVNASMVPLTNLQEAVNVFSRSTNSTSESLTGLELALNGVDLSFLSVGKSAKVSGEEIEKLPATTSKPLEKVAKSLTKTEIAAINLELSFQKVTNQTSSVLQGWAALDLKASELAIEANKAGVAFSQVGTYFLEVGQASLSAGKSFDDLLRDSSAFTTQMISNADALKGVDAAGLQAALGLEAARQKSSEAEIAFQKVTNEASNVELGFAKLGVQSKALDVGFATEQLKVDGAIATGIITNLGIVIESTGTTLSSLFSTLATAGSSLNLFQRTDLEDAISNEVNVRSKAASQQSELAEAQISFMKVKTERIASGDISIKIDGTGLAPHLEAIMFAILEEVHIKTTATEAEFLLGIPA